MLEFNRRMLFTIDVPLFIIELVLLWIFCGGIALLVLIVVVVTLSHYVTRRTIQRGSSYFVRSYYFAFSNYKVLKPFHIFPYKI